MAKSAMNITSIALMVVGAGLAFWVIKSLRG